ncbi:unnamed protein product [Angiostrongylus costaricensis]|uniref:Uncharacterized protein n=1 Tax=Angiostrongylus costaricensis TaxID=334426 RepID=A0A0R3PHF4_ANGCS|nr:unnamed protein product [Angiostrongylus costaricensis]
MSTQKVADEALGKAVRWHIFNYRKALIVVAVGIVSVIAGTTYLIIRNTQKRKKEKEDKPGTLTYTVSKVIVHPSKSKTSWTNRSESDTSIEAKTSKELESGQIITPKTRTKRTKSMDWELPFSWKDGAFSKFAPGKRKQSPTHQLAKEQDETKALSALPTVNDGKAKNTGNDIITKSNRQNVEVPEEKENAEISVSMKSTKSGQSKTNAKHQ